MFALTGGGATKQHEHGGKTMKAVDSFGGGGGASGYGIVSGMKRAGLAAAVCVAVATLAGCGSSMSMSDRVSDNQNVDAVCLKAGVQEIAAERTRVYRCSWSPLAGRTTSPCYADLDGDLVDVTNIADESFNCSHVAAHIATG